MILAVGIDSVEVNRFKNWKNYNKRQLLRIFSQEEINYSFANKANYMQRLAARFAAKEAFFKAFSTAFPLLKTPFLTLAKHCSITKKSNIPSIKVNWKEISKKNPLLNIKIFVSLTHTRLTATAIIILEKL